MTVIIDRFENGFAVSEMPDGTFVNIPRVLVPDASEGDAVKITVDKSETKRLKENVKQLMDELWAD